MVTLDIDKAALFTEAEARLRRQREMKLTAARDDQSKAELDTCFAECRMALFDVCQPAYAFCTLDVKAEGNCVHVGDAVIEGTPMAAAITPQSRTMAYLMTLSYDSQAMLASLNNDYVIYHFQHLLGREVLFALGREIFNQHCALHPEMKFRRHAIKMRKDAFDAQAPASEAVDNYWDPAIVTTLLGCFGENNLGVSVTASGCFSPLQTLLGVMVGNPVEEKKI